MPRPYLIFVDTNIFLDFYRFANDKSLELLELLNINQSKIVRTYQVEMEYKKNRRTVIFECYKKLSSLQPIQLPTFLATSKEAGFIESRIKKINERLQKMKFRIEEMLENPTTKDQVYKQVQRLLTTDSPLNLNRKKGDTLRRKIQHLAKNRFFLGYPPRKEKDNSIGDALNWEWIIHIAKQESSNIAIVTRDQDYGFFHNKPHVSDWLTQEFHDRVSKQGKIVLCNHLSQALKLAGVNITKEAVNVEEKEVATQKTVPTWQLPTQFLLDPQIVSGSLADLSSIKVPFVNFQISATDFASYMPCPKCGDAMYSIGDSPRRCRKCEGPFPEEQK